MAVPATHLTREAKAGYAPQRVRRARSLIVGLGAIGANAEQTLGLLGVSASCVDMDTVTDTGLTRGPLFARADEGRPKAQAAAERALAIYPTPEGMTAR